MKRRKSTLRIGNYKILYGDSGIKPTYTHTAAGKFKSCLSMLISCYKEDRYPWAYQSHHHHQSLRTTSKEIPRKSIWEDVWHWCLFIGFEIQHTLIAFAICDTAKSVVLFSLFVYYSFLFWRVYLVGLSVHIEHVCGDLGKAEFIYFDRHKASKWTNQPANKKTHPANR